MQKIMVRISILMLVFVGLVSCSKQEDPAIAEINQFIKTQKIDKKGHWKTSLNKPPMVKFSPNKKYIWEITTNKGVMEIELMPQVAPMHVSSTIYLANLGFYDDLVFHRVIKGFMAQGGDPLGSGRGFPGYKYAGEFSDAIKHDKPGLLSMANAGPNTDGSQFFLTFVPTPHLDGRHTIFGTVSKGIEVLKALEAAGSRTGKTTEELKMIKTRIIVR